uniref:Uncharacterized protein n=1 Tax=Anguilla anguilla TaxID=7936 RepID=A0A0E9S9X0_ANGAN
MLCGKLPPSGKEVLQRGIEEIAQNPSAVDEH